MRDTRPFPYPVKLGPDGVLTQPQSVAPHYSVSKSVGTTPQLPRSRRMARRLCGLGTSTCHPTKSPDQRCESRYCEHRCYRGRRHRDPGGILSLFKVFPVFVTKRRSVFHWSRSGVGLLIFHWLVGQLTANYFCPRRRYCGRPVGHYTMAGTLGISGKPLAVNCGGNKKSRIYPKTDEDDSR